MTETENKAVPLDSLVPTPESIGAKPIDDALINNYQQVTGKNVPTSIRRGIYNAHIGFDELIERKRNNKPFYIFLSIIPSNRLTNLSHIVSFGLAKKLQDDFDCPVVIHINDSKAFLRDTNLKFDEVKKMTEETILDVLSFGFNQDKTAVLINTESLSLNYVLLCDLQRKCTLGSYFEAFKPNDNISISIIDAIFQNASFSIPEYLQRLFPNYQEYRCLMILRATQKRLYDYICNTIIPASSTESKQTEPPMAIFGGFVPALQGGQKMPSLAKFALAQKGTQPKNGKKKNEIRDYMTIYLSNTTKEISKKLNSLCFSGGQDTLSGQQEKGANLDIDVSFYYLKIFEQDDQKLAEIRRTYGPGDLPEGNDKRMTTGSIKKYTSDVISGVITELQNSRKNIKKDMVQNVTKIRPLNK
ncbi:hypothetical protein M9Y10_044082 [Tritrichomonas musculus]|uniref:Tryptophanyl-tRNA synthetase n=1 Tax=Tritrichomonas musculus TaxID=1915356 RepID=A0ABR2K383_9EUKA